MSISYNRHLNLNSSSHARQRWKDEDSFEYMNLATHRDPEQFVYLPETVSLTDPLYVFPFASSKHSVTSGLLVLAPVVNELVEAEEGVVVVIEEHKGTSQSSHAPSGSL